jgi:hypothetical protein
VSQWRGSVFVGAGAGELVPISLRLQIDTRRAPNRERKGRDVFPQHLDSRPAFFPAWPSSRREIRAADDGHRLYIINDGRERMYGMWTIPRDEADLPVIVRTGNQPCHTRSQVG